MAPLRRDEEIRSQIRVFESIMERDERGTNCMVCSKTYERSSSPETMLITILKHTYCKICITSKLQTDDANEFIIGVITGWSASPPMVNVAYEDREISSEDSENASVDSSDGIQSLPRGYVYPNSKFMQSVQRGIRNKKVSYSSLRMNAEAKYLKQKVQKGTENKKGTLASLRMNAKPKPKSETRRMMEVGVILETSLNEFALASTKRRKIICNDNWLPEQGIKGELLPEMGDDDDPSQQSESVNKP